jgi:hypothetical protein
VKESTGFDEGMGELGLNIEGLLRRSARQLIQQAIEGEVRALLEEYAAVRMVDGRRAVVRNGYLPEREILTVVGPVPVPIPKVRDRSGSGVVFRSSPGTALRAQVAERGRSAILAVSAWGIVGTDARGAVRPPGRGGQGAFSGRFRASEG